MVGPAEVGRGWASVGRICRGGGAEGEWEAGRGGVEDPGFKVWVRGAPEGAVDWAGRGLACGGGTTGGAGGRAGGAEGGEAMGGVGGLSAWAVRDCCIIGKSGGMGGMTASSLITRPYTHDHTSIFQH